MKSIVLFCLALAMLPSAICGVLIALFFAIKLWPLAGGL